MTSDIDVSKTNEFLRRRKLRLQQVREQSKDIAKKIRQRAKVEKLRHGVNIDAKKEKEYFECQEKLVKRLELLYTKSLENVGASHKNALEVNQTDVERKTDLSKLRGKEAVTELRKRKQEKLDEQKKILDRKLHAREIANELSREKSSNVTKSLTKQINKSENKTDKHNSNLDNANDTDKSQNRDSAKVNTDVTKTDMGTQWEFAELPKEWEPNVPALSLPKDDTGKDLTENSEKNKRLNLFALSDEMPSSLRGGLTCVVPETAHSKPSLTLVSEYLQNRNLKLREFEPVKKTADDLQSIKQTILHTRASRADGSISDNICHVLDKQFVNVPSWRAEYLPGFGDPQPLQCTFNHPTNNLHAASPKRSVHTKQIFKWSKNMKSVRGTEPVSGNKDKSARSTDPELTLTRKKSISIYNHNTRDTVDIPYNEEEFIAHNKQTDDDAYAQALQETASMNNMEKEQLNKRQKEIRNKIAVNRHNVDKEYRDTLAFLNSLPKDKGNKPVKMAYMDDHQQQLEKDKHQRKMQLEFKKIEKECHKQHCKHNKRKTLSQNSRSSSKSPINEGQQRKNFEYSWMPVPESDGSFAIHTIPTTKKSGNTVKFSEADTYHEYRSRHKHTPPTKDNDQRHKNIVETLIVQSNESEENDDSIDSETSSVENMSLSKEKKLDSELKDAERIIIYKILDSKNKKKPRKKVEAKSASINGVREINNDIKQKPATKQKDNIPSSSFDNLEEGIYKGSSSKGDNVTSMYFSENSKETKALNQNNHSNNSRQCPCQNIVPDRSKDIQNEGGENTSSERNPVCTHCGTNANIKSLSPHPSAATSTSSFKTAPNDKSGLPINSNNGFIKMVDDAGQETGKFYIGASGFIKDDNYEVVIQLRKKEGDKAIPEIKNQPIINLVENSEKPNELLTQDIDQSKPAPNVDSIIEKRISSVRSNTSAVADTKSAVDSVINIEQQPSITEENENIIAKPTSKATTCEKAVHTSFEDTYAIPVYLPKTDPLPRPATSTYTQTSFSSSLQRPAFMHMSSSTSTAYMSPPELIIPDFLKQDHILTHDELFESENTVYQPDSQDEPDEDGCQEYECRCNHCTCVVKVPRINIKRKERNATSTPPNTAQSSNKDPAEEKEYRKKKCKCSGRSQTKICHKSHKKRTITESSKPSKDYSADSKITKSMPFEQKQLAKTINQKVDKNDNEINPVVKKYVNKLLSLNREGLKAIEIINQDCSIASTPGVSIIDVSSNINVKQTSTNNLHTKISLEQLKNTLREQILKESDCKNQKDDNSKTKSSECLNERNSKCCLRLPKKKSVHKVKSLNISRQVLHKKKMESRRPVSKNTTSTSSSTREENINSKPRSKSSPTPRSYENYKYKNSTSSDIADLNSNKFKAIVKKSKPHNYVQVPNNNTKSYYTKDMNSRVKKPKTYTSSDSEVPSIVLRHLNAPQSPTNISTQTNGSIDVESNFIKVAEDKLQNMEKIADLTEKCTKRLSNLAKVLEEVRKNKSLVYSQISTSDTASDAENKSDKNENSGILNPVSNTLLSSKEIQPAPTMLLIPENVNERNIFEKDSIEYTPILNDIPRPTSFLISSHEIIPETDKTNSTNALEENLGSKTRGRPPPALSRVNLKNRQEFCVTPHELSTVIEVDSPMSIKLKNQSSQQDTKLPLAEKSDKVPVDKQETTSLENEAKPRTDPDLLQRNATLSRHQPKVMSGLPDNSKMHPMDLKQFNNIMLKPFISLQDYAKQCNIGLDEGSNIEDVMRDDPINDEISSLHSDGSLPDVIAELLKRKMISEPFRFDSASNVNSTTLSSESTLSILALSKTRKHKKKTSVVQKNKENVGETSETLSMSSNPDLENAFQKLGMGWASSTLKKTKERLALSSSSNTSSSSMTQFKIRTFSQDVPTLVTDSTSSLLDVSNNRDNKLSSDCNIPANKNAVQQTSLVNSMTVKEFLTNELAKKITFSNNTRNETDEQFMSLYETNIPDNMKNTIVEKDVKDDQSVASATNNRARTSTPVQIYKSTTYSTSSSNASNGLFSNADDLSSVKVTSTSVRNHSTSDKDDLTIPNYSLKLRKEIYDYSKSD